MRTHPANGVLRCRRGMGAPGTSCNASSLTSHSVSTLDWASNSPFFLPPPPPPKTAQSRGVQIDPIDGREGRPQHHHPHQCKWGIWDWVKQGLKQAYGSPSQHTCSCDAACLPQHTALTSWRAPCDMRTVEGKLEPGLRVALCICWHHTAGDCPQGQP